jgi:hypothetical protein
VQKENEKAYEQLNFPLPRLWLFGQFFGAYAPHFLFFVSWALALDVKASST